MPILSNSYQYRMTREEESMEEYAENELEVTDEC